MSEMQGLTGDGDGAYALMNKNALLLVFDYDFEMRTAAHVVDIENLGFAPIGMVDHYGQVSRCELNYWWRHRAIPAFRAQVDRLLDNLIKSREIKSRYWAEGSPMAFQPKLVGVKKEADGWVKKYVLTYELADGALYDYHCATRREESDYLAELERNGQASRDAMEAIGSGAEPSTAYSFVPDAVCIVAITPRRTVVMEREFRYPLNSWCAALPAGLVDPGEDAAACAKRELEEETGYSVIPGSSVRLLPQPGYSSTGLTDETVQVVFVEAERTGEACTETNELIEVFELPLAEIDEFLRTNSLPIGTRAQLILEMLKHW